MCRAKEVRRYLKGQCQTSTLSLKFEVKNGHKWACLGHNYVVHCEILKLLSTFVNNHWMVCRAKELRRYLQGQGHTLSSKITNGHKWACPGHNYVVHCEILKSFGIFVHHHWTVCHAKEVRRYLQGQGHPWSSKVKNGHKWSCPGHNYVIHCEILKWLYIDFLNTHWTACHVEEFKSAKVKMAIHDDGIIILKNCHKLASLVLWDSMHNYSVSMQHVGVYVTSVTKV